MFFLGFSTCKNFRKVGQLKESHSSAVGSSGTSNSSIRTIIFIFQLLRNQQGFPTSVSPQKPHHRDLIDRMTYRQEAFPVDQPTTLKHRKFNIFDIYNH